MLLLQPLSIQQLTRFILIGFVISLGLRPGLDTGTIFSTHILAFQAVVFWASSSYSTFNMCSRLDYLRLHPLWGFHDGCGFSHVADRTPCGLKRGAALYNSETSHLRVRNLRRDSVQTNITALVIARFRLWSPNCSVSGEDRQMMPFRQVFTLKLQKFHRFMSPSCHRGIVNWDSN